MISPASALVGCWLLASSGADSRAEERVEVQFKPSGELLYATLEKGKWSVILLTYRAEGNHIISNQPSAPRDEKTEFSLRDGNTLTLSFGGEPSSYTRISACTFPAAKQSSSGLVSRVKRWLS
jgi:hypothetical protein